MDDDLRARYLRQQMEIGGPEVILRSARATARSGPAPSPEPVPDAPPSHDARAAFPPLPRPPDPVSSRGHRPAPGGDDGESKDWREGAPPIPGPGLTVQSPDPELLGGVEGEGGAWPTLDAVASAVANCRLCPLCETRTNTVPGEGSPQARFMCVGEGPGQREDETGRPFVGRAGELLDRILGAVGLTRNEVFIANVVKCRPPQNRKPLPDEQAACLPYLRRQIALIRPKVLLALGGTAAEALLGARKSLGQLRGQVHRIDGVPLVVTYHPAALLRNPHWKKPTWDDVRIARQLLDA